MPKPSKLTSILHRLFGAAAAGPAPAPPEAPQLRDGPPRDLAEDLPGSVVYRYVEEPDGSLRLLYVSPGLIDFCGVPAEVALASPQRIVNRFDPAMLAAYAAEKARCAASGSDFLMDLRHHRGDGGWRWSRVRSRPVRRPDGAVVWSGLAVDITDQQERLQALTETEAHFRQITGAIRDFIGIVDAEGRIVYLNRPIPGVAMADLIGSHYSRWVDPDHAASARSAFEACCWTGQEAKFQGRKTGPDGSEHWFEVRLLPCGAPDGNIVVVLQDRSAAGQIEAALRESEAHLRSMVENAADAIFIHDQEGRFLFCNQEACNSTGYTREEFLALRLNDLMPGDEAGARTAALPMLRPGQQVSAFTPRVRRKDGSTFPVEVRVSLIGLGEPRRILGIARNLEALGREPIPVTPMP